MDARAEPILRAMRADELDAVAALICASTNAWYKSNRGFDVFTAGEASCRLFPETYEALDPGCCVVAEDPAALGRLMGSCFYHPRETHVSLGIMNVSPAHFGRGVASRLLRFVTDYAAGQGKPVRLVSSAMNLDSFSTYSRAGFVPRATFADMQVAPERAAEIGHADSRRVRPATLDDVAAMVALEEQMSGIRREKDFRFFIENRQAIWHTLVYETDTGGADGFLVSVHHPGSHMLGPGVMLSDDVAAALVAGQLRHHAGRSPVFLVPLDRPALVRQMYAWGAKNVELHFAQVLGDFKPCAGVVMPTFMPETG
jgi:GNAT superfamily N-acetyltransferase